MRRVVVTGIGLVTPLGGSVGVNWRRLLNAESGIRAIDTFGGSDLPAKIGGLVPQGGSGDENFNSEDWMPSKDLKRMDTFIVYGFAAASQAVEDSGWKPESEEDRYRTGVMIGSGIGGLSEIAKGALTVETGNVRRLVFLERA